MAKTKNLCKKPLLILSLCMVIAFAAALIIMAVVPYAATPYTRLSDTLGETKVEYVFKKDAYEHRIYNENDWTGETVTKNNYEYSIEDGTVKGGVIVNGKINAYELVIGDTVYTNTFTKVLKIVSIVGVSLGGVGLVLYFVLNNKNGKTKKSSKKK